MLALRVLYVLLDELVDCQITDQLSSLRFLGVDLMPNIPDCTASWRLRHSDEVFIYG